MERRKTTPSKTSLLPKDYLSMVSEVFSSHFDAGMKILAKTLENPRFEAVGEVYIDEIVVAVSLVGDHQLAATTIFASSDFDPKANIPSIQDILAACIDAIGMVFGSFLAPEQPEVIEKLGASSLSTLENVPFNWVKMESDQKIIYVKMDKSNPTLDTIANEWLAKSGSRSTH